MRYSPSCGNVSSPNTPPHFEQSGHEVLQERRVFFLKFLDKLIVHACELKQKMIEDESLKSKQALDHNNEHDNDDNAMHQEASLSTPISPEAKISAVEGQQPRPTVTSADNMEVTQPLSLSEQPSTARK